MSLKLEKGKFYKHEKGRCIAILDDVDTYKWGILLVVEETDHTGHSISCVDGKAEDLHERWVEISKDEWLVEFNNALLY